MVQLSYCNLHPLLDCVSLNLKSLDMMQMTFDLLLLVTDLLPSRNQLVLLLALITLKPRVILVGLVQFVALML